MNAHFISLSKISDKIVVAKVLDDWFVKKIDLFVYFGGSGKKCRLSRCISPSFHISGEKLISDGDEYYVSADSPAHLFLKFIPDLPLKSHLKVKKSFKISMYIQGEYYNYEYSGTAIGYWKVIPTQISGFNGGNYIVKNKDGFDIQNAAPGSVFIYSISDGDYLDFKEDVQINNDDLFIEISVLNSMLPSFSLPSAERIEQRYVTKNYTVALFLMMRNVAVESDGIPIVSKFKPDYDLMWQSNISESTLCEWFQKPELYTDIRQRFTLEKRQGMILFISMFCKKKILQIKKGMHQQLPLS